jgi:hypothetical protein
LGTEFEAEVDVEVGEAVDGMRIEVVGKVVAALVTSYTLHAPNAWYREKAKQASASQVPDGGCAGIDARLPPTCREESGVLTAVAVAVAVVEATLAWHHSHSPGAQ